VKRSPSNGVSASGGWGLSAFTPDDLGRLHEASLEVIENTGVLVEACEEAFEIFASAGARVERQGADALIKVPASVVEECLRSAPRAVVLKGRIAAADYALDPHRVTFAPMGELVQIVDLTDGTLRPTTRQDSADITLLCDSLDEVGVMHRPVASLDKPAGLHPIFNAESLFANTGKHVFIGPGDAANLAAIARIAFAHVGGAEEFARRPIFTAIVAPVSPLTMGKDCAEMIIASAKLDGGGIVCAPAIVGGATGPVTVAGSLVCTNVEFLSGLILAQLVRRGTRVVYANSSAMMELRTGNHAYGAPEMGMIDAASTRLAQHYGLPNLVSAFPSGGKVADPQMGYESAMNGLLAALAGANVVNGLGALEFGLTFDYAKFMLDVDCARMIRAILAGIPLTDEQLALDVIAEVGPGGQYLSHKHTSRHMRERSQAKLFDRQSRHAWSRQATPDLVERAREQARAVLATHQPPPVSDATRAEVEEIIAELVAGQA
jgi:trimethylamine--corrinoid protein Co-methyltransferase